MVFISYAKEDRKIAQKLYNDLKSEGIEAWLDREKILPGQNWKLIIKQTIKDSSYFLALLSSNSINKKGYVQKELKIALDLLDEFSSNKIFMIPIRLDDCEPAEEKLKDIHWIDLFESYENALKELLRVLKPVNNSQLPTGIWKRIYYKSTFFELIILAMLILVFIALASGMFKYDFFKNDKIHSNIITKKQTVTTESKIKDTNEHYTIILDQSGSMREKVPGKPELGYYLKKDHLFADKVQGAMRVIYYVINNLNKGDYFSVITFGEVPKMILSCQQVENKYQLELIKNQIEDVPFADQHTDVLSGFVESKDMLNSLDLTTHHNILILITDGVNNPPAASPYFDPKIQKVVYKELGEIIFSKKWSLFLVGIGEYTKGNIDSIAQKLNVSSDNTIILENLQNSEELTEKLIIFFNSILESTSS